MATVTGSAAGGTSTSARKPRAKSSGHRVVVELTEESYQRLERLAKQEMRELKNMVSFLFNRRIKAILDEYESKQGEHQEHRD